VHRSSESIAALAAALAKAQAELVNPEKSLTATLKPEGGSEPERSFRYASLASGLDIVRKTLGSHEIATVQTTAIDPTAGMVNLTTVLAHASGQWISSDWPVCPVAETSTPHRMGAALTYARRHALFTLVGITGDDDLDAPDLHDASRQKTAVAIGSGGAHSPRAAQKTSPRPTEGVLDPSASQAARERLLGELQTLDTPDAMAAWASGAMATKNQLIDKDAAAIEDAFRNRLATLEAAAHPRASAPATDPEAKRNPSSPSSSTSEPRAAHISAESIDKSSLIFPEPRRVRDKVHRKFVATQPCLVCGRRPSDAHHLRFTQPRALGRKVSDEFTVPLCRGHHREVHRCGDEADWWRRWGIDALAEALRLWSATRASAQPSNPPPAIPVFPPEVCGPAVWLSSERKPIDSGPGTISVSRAQSAPPRPPKRTKGSWIKASLDVGKDKLLQTSWSRSKALPPPKGGRP
jgi:hypothetical protein